MIDIQAFFQGIETLFSWSPLMYMVLGLVVGIVLGAIPGLSGSLGIAILLPTTYYMTSVDAILFLSAIFTGSIYAGGVTAILLNIPGSPGAIVTTLDGYEMTKQGQQMKALGIGLGSSFIGCIFGYLVILFFLQPFGKLVLSFGPPEMLILTFFALSVICVMEGSIVRTLIAGVLGLLIGTIGATAYGRSRGTFDIPELYEGIQLVPALIGLLAIAEIFFLIYKESIVENKLTNQRNFKDLIEGLFIPFKYKINLIRSAFIGLFIGLMPAAGSSIASVVSYGQAQTWSKNKGKLGKGHAEGIVAPETANNASEGGAMATMMSLGIPGSGATALLMVAFMIHGLSPGPYLIRDHLDLTYAVIIGNIIQGFLLIGLGLLFIWYFSRLALVPTKILIPIVIVLSFLGALATRGLMVDVALALAFGVLGLIFREYNYPIIALLLGIILGPNLDVQYTRTSVLYSGQYEILLQRPAFLGIFALTLIMFIIIIFKSIRDRKSQQA